MLAKIGFLAILLLGVSIGLAFDRRPVLGFHTPPVPWVGWRFGFDLPGGPLTVARAGEATAVAAASKAAAKTQACTVQMNAQGASIVSAHAILAGKAADAASGLRRAVPQADRLMRARAPLVGYVARGVDVCSQWSAADRAVLESMK